MRGLGLVAAAAATAAAALLAAPACMVAVAGVAEQGWLFPGDPPYLDVSLMLAAVAMVSGLAGATLFRRQLAASRLGGAAWWPYGIALTATTVATATALTCLGGVGYRHSVAWRGVRNGLAHYGGLIASDVGDRRQILTEQQFRALQRRLLPSPVPIELPGWGTVRLRMAHAQYPYVGVDFGDGRHALFDPDTMICIYSD